MGWYYAISSDRIGPIADSEFESLVANGTITPTTLVWRQGMAGWLPYAQAASGGTGPEEDPNSALCAVSGKRFPKDQMLQYEGRWVSAEHRDVFFQRLREGLNPAAADTMPGPFGYAGFWWRAMATLLDGIIVFVVTQVTNGLLGLAMLGKFMWVGDNSPPDVERIGHFLAYTFATVGINLVIGLGFEWFFLAKYQATPGKLALGMKVVRADGSRLGHGRIIGRHFSKMLSQLILFIGYMMAGWDDQKRGLHDLICDTRVIHTR